MSLNHEAIVPDHSKRPLLHNLALIDRKVTEDSHIFSWEGMMSLVSWYDSIPFHFHIFSISALMLTYYDARNRCNASCEPMRLCLMLNFH